MFSIICTLSAILNILSLLIKCQITILVERSESYNDDGFENTCVMVTPDNAIEAHRMGNNYKVEYNLNNYLI